LKYGRHLFTVIDLEAQSDKETFLAWIRIGSSFDFLT
jgi:hypothetical protein